MTILLWLITRKERSKGAREKKIDAKNFKSNRAWSCEMDENNAYGRVT